MDASEDPLSAGTGGYPVREDVANDRRFEMLARDVGLVLEQHAYPRVRGADRQHLEAFLIEFLYVPRTAVRGGGEGSGGEGGPCAQVAGVATAQLERGAS